MKKLSFNNVFSKYKVPFSEKLARIIYSIYKRSIILLSKVFPKKKFNQFVLEDDGFPNEESSDVPLGLSYKTHKSEEGYLDLDYLDFYDYLPKEETNQFKKRLRKLISNNRIAPYSSFRTNEVYNQIDKISGYHDSPAFISLCTVKLCHNDFLNQYADRVAVALRNLSPTFLIIRYRFIINKEFNTEFNQTCQKKYLPYSEICMPIDAPWYNPRRVGLSLYTGDDARKKEVYFLLSEVKWKAFSELKKYFSMHFEKDIVFPPVFETYSTNIRPDNNHKNDGFWHSVLLDIHTDYAPKYNSCVSWEYDYSNNKGERLVYCFGGDYGTDCLPGIAHFNASDAFAIYLTADTMRRIAIRDIAALNKQISKVIKKNKTGSILKTRVSVERKLYYNYRFLNEFTDSTLDYSVIKEFKNSIFNESFTERSFRDLVERTSKTREQIKTILNILNNAAEYCSSRSTIRMQWIMMVITLLSLIIAFFMLINPDRAIFSEIWKGLVSFFRDVVF